MLIVVFQVTIGVKARLFTIVLLVLKIFGLSFAYSLGKIDHGILKNALLLCMIIAGYGRYYAVLPIKKWNMNLLKKDCLCLQLSSVLVGFRRGLSNCFSGWILT